MALFNKKLSLDDILKGIENLTPEEKEKVKAKVEDLYKAEDEREIDKVEETKADDAEVKDEKGEEVREESEEIGKDVDELEEKEKVEKVPEDIPDDTQQDKVAEDNSTEVIKDLTDRLSALEEKFKDFDDLKKLMEEFTEKQAGQYGYQGSVPGGKKSLSEMSAAELKKGILNGEY